jgi:hypothetical protein
MGAEIYAHFPLAGNPITARLEAGSAVKDNEIHPFTFNTTKAYFP